MTDTQPDLADQVRRLERRLDRERRARHKAEGFADRRMRELWLAGQELDERVSQRTEELEAAIVQRDAATNAAASFLSNLSHEMRTPLNGLLGMLELLESHVESDQGSSHLDGAQRSAARLQHLIVRLLNLVDLRSNRLVSHPVKVNLQALRDQLLERWRDRALASGHLIVVECFGADEEILYLDEERFLQVADELIHNVVLHASAGMVSIELRSTGDALELVVEDSGPGFTPPQQETLWASLTRADHSPGRAAEGAGIGLGLVTELARALGGEFTITSADGTGTRAQVQVPTRGTSGPDDSEE